MKRKRFLSTILAIVMLISLAAGMPSGAQTLRESITQFSQAEVERIYQALGHDFSVVGGERVSTGTDINGNIVTVRWFVLSVPNLNLGNYTHTGEGANSFGSNTGDVLYDRISLRIDLGQYPGSQIPNHRAYFRILLPPITGLSALEADAHELIQRIENNHIAFGLELVPSGYESAKQSFLSSLRADMSVIEFGYEANRFLSVLRDGHTFVRVNSGMFLPFNWRWNGDSLVMLEEWGNIPKGAKITHIGGKSVDELAQTAMMYYPTENNSGVELVVEDLLRTQTFHQIILKTTVGNAVTVTYDFNSVQKGEVSASFNTSRLPTLNPGVTSHEIRGDTFIFRVSSFSDSAGYQAGITALGQGVNNGSIKNVIVDVRGNPGGNSSLATQIFTTMGMTVGGFGGTRFFGLDTFRDKFEMTTRPNYPFSTFSPSNHGHNPTDINLFTLVDRYTFSSAVWMAVYTQDGQHGSLGTVVGEISHNSPSQRYGDIATYSLTNTQLSYILSTTLWLRPDTNASQNELIPDILIQPGDDALLRALYEIENPFCVVCNSKPCVCCEDCEEYPCVCPTLITNVISNIEGIVIKTNLSAGSEIFIQGRTEPYNHR